MRESLSVVVPAYNEEANVGKCIKNVYSVLKKTDWDWEIIVVNDGSKDATGDVAREEIKKLGIKNARVVDNNPNRGYGGSLKRGFSESSRDFITFAHADNQFDFSQIHDLFAVQQENDADIVSGIRPRGGEDNLYRKLLRWTWNTLVRAAFGYLATDIDCGFKLFRRSILERISLPSNGAMLDTQLFAGARVRGMKISEMPVKHLPRTAGKSTGGNLHVAVRALRDLFIFWWQLKQEILVEKGKAVFRWEAVLLGLILILATILRVYDIDSHLTFLGDEGRDTMVVRDIILGRNLTIIGPGTSIGNMYLGPWYYYLMVIPLLVFNFSPVGPAMMVVVFGLLTIVLVWWIGRQWFSRSAAMLTTLLYATSMTVVIFSRSSWNPNIMPFFALLGMYGIWKIWRYGYWRWLIISTISFGFVLNSHYLGLLLLPAAGLFLLLSPRSDKSWKKYTLLSAVAFFVMMLPLIVFDITHDWLNMRAITAFFTNRQETVNLKAYKALPNILPLWTQITTSLLTAGQQLWGQVVGWAIVVVSAIVVLVQPRVRRDLIFVLVWLIVGVIGLGLYKQHIYAHYFGFIFPAVFLLFGFCIQFFFQNKVGRGLGIGLGLALVGLNLYFTPIRFEPNDQLNRTKQIAEFIVRESADKPFNLALISNRNYDKSYRYLIDLANGQYKTIHEQLTDQLFVICESPPAEGCQPINNPLWEVAAFGWAKIDRQWEFPWGVEVYRLVHNQDGKSE